MLKQEWLKNRSLSDVIESDVIESDVIESDIIECRVQLNSGRVIESEEAGKFCLDLYII